LEVTPYLKQWGPPAFMAMCLRWTRR
jgi:hypothetical protein